MTREEFKAWVDAKPAGDMPEGCGILWTTGNVTHLCTNLTENDEDAFIDTAKGVRGDRQ